MNENKVTNMTKITGFHAFLIMAAIIITIIMTPYLNWLILWPYKLIQLIGMTLVPFLPISVQAYYILLIKSISIIVEILYSGITIFSGATVILEIQSSRETMLFQNKINESQPKILIAPDL